MSTITKTVGIGGDYANIGAAWSYLLGFGGGLINNFVFNVISDFTENIGIDPTTHIKLNQLTVSFNGNGFTVTFPNGGVPYDFRNSDTDNQGAFYWSNFTFVANTVSVATILSGAPQFSGYGVSIYVSNCIFIGSGPAVTLNGFSMQDHLCPTYISNCIFYNLKVGLSAAPNDIHNGTNLIVENCTIYNCGKGVTLWTSTSTRYVTIKNTVSFGNTTNDWYCSGGASYAFNQLLNCADTDGSIATCGATYSNRVTAVTSSEFTSVDPTSANFLKIPTNKRLYGVGLTTGLLSANTSSIEGYPRPNVFGVVSIGAHEPDVAIDFTASPLTPAIYDDVLFTQILKQATIITYDWNIGEGKHLKTASPTGFYGIPGLKTVSLTVYDTVGRSTTVTKVNYITVHNYGVGFTEVPIKGISPLEVQFDASFARI
jgi:hypothetical protein